MVIFRGNADCDGNITRFLININVYLLRHS